MPWRILFTVLFFANLPGNAGAQDFFTLKGHGGPIKGIAVGADGAILTASFDNSVGLWRNGAAIWLEGHAAAVNAVSFLDDGRIVSAGDDFSVRLWDRLGENSDILGKHAGKVIRLAVSADNARVASASWDGTVSIWTLDGNVPPIEIRGHSGVVNDVAFSQDGERLYSASADGTIRIWDVLTGKPLRRVVSHGFGINTLAVNKDDSWIAYGSVDGATRIVDLSDEIVIGDFTADRRPILAMAFHQESQRIAVGDAHGYIMIIDTETWRIANDFRATLNGPIWALTFSVDGLNIHAGGLDNAMYSWPLDSLRNAAQMANSEHSYLTPSEEMSNGERQFQRKCSICHALGPSSERRAGPTLHNIFGRPAGSIDGYSYSETLQDSKIVWTNDTINLLFDQGPDVYIPGSKMPMQRITGSDDRADLIAYLRTTTAGDQN